MKVNILEVNTVNELNFYWKKEDYIQLLHEFGLPDTDGLKDSEIFEYIQMSVSELEPNEAAELVLQYKLGDKLNENQIQNISNEMMIDRVAEEYRDPALHCDLYNINQLLYKAYNGKFPNTEASIIKIQIENFKEEITQEVLTKAIAHGLNDHNLLHRLFPKQISGEMSFTDLENVIWHIDKKEDNTFEVTTSKYWISKEDFRGFEYDCEIEFHEEE